MLPMHPPAATVHTISKGGVRKPEGEVAHPYAKSGDEPPSPIPPPWTVLNYIPWLDYGSLMLGTLILLVTCKCSKLVYKAIQKCIFMSLTIFELDLTFDTVQCCAWALAGAWWWV